eukprot:COSAG04_NODE_4843_length_1867_cov_1.992081_2_plen_171_part_00
MPVREGYLCLRRGLKPPLDLSPLALRLRDLRLQRGPLRRHGVFGARTRTLQLRRLKPNRTSWLKDGSMDKGEGWCQVDDRHNITVKNGPTTFACHCHGVGQAAEAQLEGVWVTISLCCMRSSATSFCAIVSSCAFRSSSVCRHTKPTTQHDISHEQTRSERSDARLEISS